MFSFLLAVSLGAYASQRISVFSDGQIATATIDYSTIWQDAIAFFTLIGRFYQWSMSLGRTSRAYADSTVIRWLNAQGVSVALPNARPLVNHQ